MDPVSLGIAAAALIATKGAEEFGTEAGKRLWGIVGRIYDAVAERLTGRGEQEALITTAHGQADDNTSEASLAEMIGRHASASPEFRTTIEQLVDQAQSDATAASVVAQAFDNSKQINFGGDNSGPITL